MKTKEAAAVTIKPLEEFEDYAAAAAKRSAIKSEIRGTESRRKELLDAFRESKGRGLEDQARALLDDPTSNGGPSVGSIREEIGGLRSREKVLGAALRLADGRVLGAKMAASRELCDAVLPAYEERLQAVARALEGLHAACAEERRFIDQVMAAGYSASGLDPAPFPGGLAEPNGFLATWLHRARDRGLHVAMELPPEGFGPAVREWRTY